jgi:hypothetical protein
MAEATIDLVGHLTRGCKSEGGSMCHAQTKMRRFRQPS